MFRSSSILFISFMLDLKIYIAESLFTVGGMITECNIDSDLYQSNIRIVTGYYQMLQVPWGLRFRMQESTDTQVEENIYHQPTVDIFDQRHLKLHLAYLPNFFPFEPEY